jgi:hypothetical protein
MLWAVYMLLACRPISEQINTRLENILSFATDVAGMLKNFRVTAATLRNFVLFLPTTHVD